MISAFDNQNYFSCYPISYLMRRHTSDWWFRIHSLPDSKRYAESESDWKTLLDRHRELSDFVLKLGKQCRVSYCEYFDADSSIDELPSLDWRLAKEFNVENDPSQKILVWTAMTEWKFESFEPWIRAVADDKLRDLSFHSENSDSLYIPYDGGADVFSLNPKFLEEVRVEFSRWRSSHPEGL